MSSPRPRLSLDVESTLANTNAAFLGEYNSINDTDYSYYDIDTWQWVREEVDFQEFMDIVEWVWKYAQSRIRPFEQNIGETVSQLSKSFEVDIVTARSGVEQQMKQWLWNNGIVDYHQFISGETDMNKATLGYDYLIDDKPGLVDDISDGQELFLFAQPYNNGFGGDQRNVTTVDSVKQVADMEIPA